jgi:hypothetical protein
MFYGGICASALRNILNATAEKRKSSTLLGLADLSNATAL